MCLLLCFISYLIPEIAKNLVTNTVVMNVKSLGSATKLPVEYHTSFGEIIAELLDAQNPKRSSNRENIP